MVCSFKGAYRDATLVLAHGNFSYTRKAAIHNLICFHHEGLSFHNCSCCAVL